MTVVLVHGVAAALLGVARLTSDAGRQRLTSAYTVGSSLPRTT
jgi:hypothetical protein